MLGLGLRMVSGVGYNDSSTWFRLRTLALNDVLISLHWVEHPSR